MSRKGAWVGLDADGIGIGGLRVPKLFESERLSESVALRTRGARFGKKFLGRKAVIMSTTLHQAAPDSYCGQWRTASARSIAQNTPSPRAVVTAFRTMMSK
jgi:hypothetical protein